MKRLFILILVILPLAAFADSFDDFKKGMNEDFQKSKTDFKEYRTEEERSFGIYKKILDEEFLSYKTAIAESWDEVIVSDSKRWVEYLNNYRVRKTVDFEKRLIRIDVIGGREGDFKPILKDLLTEDRADAFRRDPVSFNTEKKLREQVPNLRTDKVGSEPVLGDIFGSDRSIKDPDKLAEELLAESTLDKEKSGKTGDAVASLTVKLPEDTYKRAAEKVLPFVEKYSSRFKVESALVMSVIYNESRFNPLAKSYVPAYGLMQIVPKSAGIDAILFLEGKKRVLAPSYLYNSENNVKIGSAYLHILYYRYFRNIKNPQSRLYCSIAAYNTGAGNVAYAFNRGSGERYSIAKAVPKINALSPAQVYNHLRNYLKYNEAKKYIVNVTNKMSDY